MMKNDEFLIRESSKGAAYLTCNCKSNNVLAQINFVFNKENDMWLGLSMNGKNLMVFDPNSYNLEKSDLIIDDVYEKDDDARKEFLQGTNAMSQYIKTVSEGFIKKGFRCIRPKDVNATASVFYDEIIKDEKEAHNIYNNYKELAKLIPVSKTGILDIKSSSSEGIELYEDTIRNIQETLAGKSAVKLFYIIEHGAKKKILTTAEEIVLNYVNSTKGISSEEKKEEIDSNTQHSLSSRDPHYSIIPQSALSSAEAESVGGKKTKEIGIQ